MRYIVTTHLEIEDGFFITDYVPMLKIDTDNESDLLNSYNELLQNSGINADIYGLDLTDIGDFNSTAFDGTTLIADRASNFYGNADVVIYHMC